MDYAYTQAQQASRTGVPIVRPLFLADPKAPAAWSNGWTFLCGPDILVSPVWGKNKRSQQGYLPAGARWHDAWRPGAVHKGGQAITMPAELCQMPLFVRDGAALDLGDLNQEWKDATAVASKKPDLKVLEAEVLSWFEKYRQQK